MTLAIQKHLAPFFGPAPRKTPTAPFLFESWGAGYYRVASRGSGNTVGYVAKIGNAWEAKASISGPGWENPPTEICRTRAEAGRWCWENSNLRYIDR